MTKDEALKMAIKEMTDAIPHLDIHFDDYFEAINACKEALEQPTVAELNDEYLRDTNVIGLEQPAEPRLVSYALDGSTCTLNIDGEEVYFNREQPAQKPVFWMKDMVLYYDKPDDIFIYTPLYTHPHQCRCKE